MNLCIIKCVRFFPAVFLISNNVKLCKSVESREGCALVVVETEYVCAPSSFCGSYPIFLDLSPLLIRVVGQGHAFFPCQLCHSSVLVLRFRSNGSRLVLNQSKHPMVELRFLQR